jgi:hypothetical protein
VVAVPQAGAKGNLTIAVGDGLQLNDPPAAAIEDTAPLRDALSQMLAAWKSGARPADPILAAQIDQAKKQGETPEKLSTFLSAELKPTAVNWSLRTPPRDGQFPITVRGPDGAALTLTAILGDAAPPGPVGIGGDPGSSLAEVRLVYDQTPAKHFWEPLAGVTWQPIVARGWNHWDGSFWIVSGWLFVYLIAYVPAMFLARKVLRLA